MKDSRHQGERWLSDKGMERTEAEKAARANASQIEKGRDGLSEADLCFGNWHPEGVRILSSIGVMLEQV